MNETAAPKDGLSEAQRTFCLEWRKNGFNATAAYEAAHPGVTKGSANVGGWRMLRNVKVAAYLKDDLEAFYKAQHLEGDRVLALVAGDCLADPRDLFDEAGKMLKPHEWPADVALSIESVELREDGGMKVRLVSKQASRRTLLEQTGKLATLAGGIDELAAAIRADQAKHNGGTD